MPLEDLDIMQMYRHFKASVGLALKSKEVEGVKICLITARTTAQCISTFHCIVCINSAVCVALLNIIAS